jgi:hypothetical protein
MLHALLSHHLLYDHPNYYIIQISIFHIRIKLYINYCLKYKISTFHTGLPCIYVTGSVFIVWSIQLRFAFACLKLADILVTLFVIMSGLSLILISLIYSRVGQIPVSLKNRGLSSESLKSHGGVMHDNVSEVYCNFLRE